MGKRVVVVLSRMEGVSGETKNNLLVLYSIKGCLCRKQLEGQNKLHGPYLRPAW